MGKHKKFLKSEKSKVKLKGNKLKTAQNVTKTEFKVRKIVITEQLRNVVKEGSEGIRKKHNVNDCITRLSHSTSVEAISNLKDIILYQKDDFLRNMELIIKTISNMCLSIEKNDRRESLKMLELVFINSSAENLRPFASILVTYLKCAITHIKSNVQEDSLLLLDILMKYVPDIISNEKDSILMPYLDMISKMKNEKNPERSLTLLMGGKIRSMKWRISVLNRLYTFLRCINYCQQEESREFFGEKSVKIVHANEKNDFICNPYFQNNKTSSNFTSPSLTITTAKSKIKKLQISSKYVDMIMPLMFETWIELKNDTSNESNSISADDGMILELILQIILELYGMIESDDETKFQFLKRYQDRFDKIILCRFPYTQNINGEENCVYQNLSIAILFLHFLVRNQQRFMKFSEKVFNFIVECIDKSCKPRDKKFIELMSKFIHTMYSCKGLNVNLFGNQTKRVFNELTKKCNLEDQTHCELICQIIEHHANEDLCNNLICQMIEILAQKSIIPIRIIKTLTKLAKRGNKTVFECIERNANGIVENFKRNIKFSGNSSDENKNIRIEVADLMYWINDVEILKKLKNQVNNDDAFSQRITDIVLCKI